MTTTLPLNILAFFFGACIGSFLNVCIYRLPSSTSIINPSRSFCPQCNTAIQFYDNIPVFSYLWLKGRCRNCKASISLRYPLVELMTGILAIAILFMFGLTLEGFIYFVLFHRCWSSPLLISIIKSSRILSRSRGFPSALRLLLFYLP